MPYSIQHIATVLQVTSIIHTDAVIEHLLIDSRRIVFPQSSLFFALHGPRRDGHQFIKDVYDRGVKNFVVEKNFDYNPFPNANFLLVDDVQEALQKLAAHHRATFNLPVIGITGSNGKTIVKEWLNQLLQEDHRIVRSPRSYNSQVGVPLSVWQINNQHTLGIFEAGISTTGEMEKLEKIIQPTIGILTNIGEAHREGFANDNEKAKEKSRLFTHCQQVVYCPDYIPVAVQLNVKLFSWSRKDNNASLFISKEEKEHNATKVHFTYKSQPYQLTIPFVDAASVDNCLTCCSVMLLLNYQVETIQQRILQLQPVEMRLQLKKGNNNCTLINDSYSNDLSSLGIALDYLKQQAGGKSTTVILSDILQSGIPDDLLYQQVAAELVQRNIKRMVGIGESISRHAALFANISNTSFYLGTEQFITSNTTHLFKDEFVLLKGARVFAFERISNWLEQKVHQTILEINLSAIAHNLKEYQKKLLPQTKLMAMVKAFSYGSGSAEVARVLQFHKVDYLAVAYTDEGVELRQAGISLPIMVMNADEAGFDALVEYNLEPEIYSWNMYRSFHHYLSQQGITAFPVHLKVNTGMNRLGFEFTEGNTVGAALQADNTMVVQSVFSHLAASEAPEFDAFTKEQAERYRQFCNDLTQHITYPFIKHIANSAGIFRHVDLQFDMVRLGIGLYGVDSTGEHDLLLQTVATLRTTIAQIRKVPATETVGYSRKGKLERDSVIATIRIGYADGLSRRMGNNIGRVWIKGQLAPIIGSVAMDMCMIDITGLAGIEEGDTVEIFGKHIPIQQVADNCGTIAYEIMTGISQRVKRVYVEE
ncbi:MAG: bifunctional UDP-N-acetylmuramoyl-tripeptide:D-alanyl-D-alanine ligase/alanine racemase [Bacteroidota bacterium]|nr:bifunctional UDP-N-acetylmuramoyl-tripeptide:D-alanyl-D-alanine ligase/alanine racemase [Bacteroidota bacterium]